MRVNQEMSKCYQRDIFMLKNHLYNHVDLYSMIQHVTLPFSLTLDLVLKSANSTH